MIWSLLASICVGLVFYAALRLLASRSLIRSLMGASLLTNAINLFLFFCASRKANTAAYSHLSGIKADPLPQALVLTAIVISMGAFAFLAAAVLVHVSRKDSLESDSMNELKG